MTSKRQTFGDRMAVLKNSRHERFAQAIAGGETQERAFAIAGYKPNASNASTLNRKQQVRDRVVTILAGAAAIVEFDTAAAVRQIDEDRAFARELQQPSAAVSASMTKFKLLGLITDKVVADVTAKQRMPTRDEVLAAQDRELAELSALANMTSPPAPDALH